MWYMESSSPSHLIWHGIPPLLACQPRFSSRLHLTYEHMGRSLVLLSTPRDMCGLLRLYHSINRSTGSLLRIMIASNSGSLRWISPCSLSSLPLVCECLRPARICFIPSSASFFSKIDVPSSSSSSSSLPLRHCHRTEIRSQSLQMQACRSFLWPPQARQARFR